MDGSQYWRVTFDYKSSPLPFWQLSLKEWLPTRSQFVSRRKSNFYRG